MTASRTLAAAALLALGSLALSGCAGSADPGDAPDPGRTGSVGSEIEVEAGWLDGGRAIALVTHGSSTCLPVVTDVQLQPDGAVAVSLSDPDGATVCTRDYVPRAVLVGLPGGVDTTAELDVVVTYGDTGRGETDLDPYTGGAVEEFSPSAGWIDDDQFAVLTWGSSTCAPVVESAAATSPTEIALTFAAFPETQPCTSDMAPRVALATVTGVDDDQAVSVTLSGGGSEFATPVTIPISG